MTQAVAPAPRTPVPAQPIAVSLRATDSLTLAGLTVLLSDRPELRVLAEDEIGGDVLVFAADRLDGRVAPALRRSAAATGRPVVLVVDEISESELLLAVECRAHAVLPRAAVTAERLARTVVAVAAGDGMLPPPLVGDLLKHLRQLQRQVLDDAGLNASGLTPREVEVIKLMAEGLETTEIAARLCYSERTVKGIIHRITRRLRLRNRSHIIAHAMRYGVI
ncbi:helix-turn-helix transcriptional regulator [Actinoallomurus rhizosphaericola]|uniref:helix-turn-helix transcriptional regulator n=1 Tax=Actinoallomurus rhizosphaericola TaxID=2952536 RepID=UPI002093E0E3|nr:response regulator transcription factor [Actinoallomurus rhizosphaericola]MCO5995314.1 response regulator transcription factor [Actinoallomurus rhizosphaericola]